MSRTRLEANQNVILEDKTKQQILRYHGSDLNSKYQMFLSGTEQDIIVVGLVYTDALETKVGRVYNTLILYLQ